LRYAKKAETIWERIRPADESKEWGSLSCIYAELNQPDLARQYARKILALPRASRFLREQAYQAMYRAAQQQQRWQEALHFYQCHVAVHDSIANNERATELVSIERQAAYDRLAFEREQEQQQNLQARQLQAQRLLTVQKQADFDRLLARTQSDALIRQNQLTEQARRLEGQQAQLRLSKQQTLQARQEAGFRAERTQQAARLERNRVWLLASGLLFLLGLTALLAWSLQLRRRRTQAELKLAQNQQQATEQVLLTQEAERQRFAADLHDDLGGTLAAVRLRLSLLRDLTTDPSMLAQLDKLEPLIVKSGQDLRRIAHNLMPPDFDDIGLGHALRLFVENQPPEPTRLQLTIRGEERALPATVELNLYRIVTELIQNVHKHAEATQATLCLDYQPTQLIITVTDNGIGNSTNEARAKSAGIGLKNNELRANYIGATLRREADNSGTCVTVEMPLVQDVPAAATPF
jgi:signal transduction histidine kinase